MQRSFYHGLVVFLFYLVFSVISVGSRNPNPLIASIVITVMTFFWFRISVNWEKFFATYNDVILNIIIYTAILSVVAFMSAAFSRDALTFDIIVLYVLPVVMWVVIWSDYFFQKMKGKL
jgi:hypothetical protein